jgi:phage tail sheath gpL-like
MCTYLSLVTVTSLNFTTWTLTGLITDLFAGIALFADGARSPGGMKPRHPML